MLAALLGADAEQARSSPDQVAGRAAADLLGQGDAAQRGVAADWALSHPSLWMADEAGPNMTAVARLQTGLSPATLHLHALDTLLASQLAPLEAMGCGFRLDPAVLAEYAQLGQEAPPAHPTSRSSTGASALSPQVGPPYHSPPLGQAQEAADSQTDSLTSGAVMRDDAGAACGRLEGPRPPPKRGGEGGDGRGGGEDSAQPSSAWVEGQGGVKPWTLRGEGEGGGEEGSSGADDTAGLVGHEDVDDGGRLEVEEEASSSDGVEGADSQGDASAVVRHLAQPPMELNNAVLDMVNWGLARAGRRTVVLTYPAFLHDAVDRALAAPMEAVDGFYKHWLQPSALYYCTHMAPLWDGALLSPTLNPPCRPPPPSSSHHHQQRAHRPCRSRQPSLRD